jgi:hypothetical protein
MFEQVASAVQKMGLLSFCSWQVVYKALYPFVYSISPQKLLGGIRLNLALEVYTRSYVENIIFISTAF